MVSGLASFPRWNMRALRIKNGTIGEVVLVQSDFFDPIYTIQAVPLGFGADAVPTSIVATGRYARGAIVAFGEDKCAVLTFPPRNSELPEVTELVGTKGRITLERPRALSDPSLYPNPATQWRAFSVQNRKCPCSTTHLRVSVTEDSEDAKCLPKSTRFPVPSRSNFIAASLQDYTNVHSTIRKSHCMLCIC